MSNGMRWTQEQVDALKAKVARLPVRGDTLAKLSSAPKKRSKYGNKKTIANGMVFDSGLEARRYTELELLQKAGRIRNLQRQVPFDLIVNGEHICTYIADAVYETMLYRDTCAEQWVRHVEDTKSPPTRRKPEYRLKAKLMKACHGIEIREVMA